MKSVTYVTNGYEKKDKWFRLQQIINEHLQTYKLFFIRVLQFIHYAKHNNFKLEYTKWS